MHAVRCPECRGEMSIDPADFGYTVACPLCGSSFTPRPPDPGSPPADEGRRENDPDEERPDTRRAGRVFDDEFDRPSRRDRTPPSIEQVRRIVAWPANGLYWTGIAGMGLCLIVGIAVAVFGVVQLNDPQVGDDGWLMISLGAAGAVGGVPYFLVILLGGRQLRRLNGTWLVYVSAVLGIATIFWCGVLWPTTWAAVTFGIWAIVALNRSEVKDALAEAADDS